MTEQVTHYAAYGASAAEGGLDAMTSAIHTPELYAATKNFAIYEPAVVPSILQTPVYAGAIMQSWAEVLGTNAGITDALEDLADRRELLGTSNRYFWFLLEEQVLYTRMIGVRDHLAQLDLIRTTSWLPNVEVEIIPNSVQQRSMAPMPGFWVFDESMAVVDGPCGAYTITDPAQIRQLTRVRSILRGDSVFGDEVMKLIAKAEAMYI